MPRKRESGIGARKTTRKPRKAARAAGTRRAPSHPATPPPMLASMPSTLTAPEAATKAHQERVTGQAG